MAIGIGSKGKQHVEEFIARSLQQGRYIPHKDPEWEADEDFYNYRLSYRGKSIEPKQFFHSLF